MTDDNDVDWVETVRTSKIFTIPAGTTVAWDCERITFFKESSLGREVIDFSELKGQRLYAEVYNILVRKGSWGYVR